MHREITRHKSSLVRAVETHKVAAAFTSFIAARVEIRFDRGNNQAGALAGNIGLGWAGGMIERGPAG